jgi:hypothetical protein
MNTKNNTRAINYNIFIKSSQTCHQGPSFGSFSVPELSDGRSLPDKLPIGWLKTLTSSNVCATEEVFQQCKGELHVLVLLAPQKAPYYYMS